MEYTPYNPITSTQQKIRRAFARMAIGKSDKTPFAVGTVEKRMFKWAKEHRVEIGSQSLYMSEHSIQHALRESKVKKSLAVSIKDLEDFPIRRYKMDLYYDNAERNFVYVDKERKTKFIIQPNYKVKILKGGRVKVVAHITSQRLSDKETFTNKNHFTKI